LASNDTTVNLLLEDKMARHKREKGFVPLKEISSDAPEKEKRSKKEEKRRHKHDDDDDWDEDYDPSWDNDFDEDFFNRR